MAVASRNNFKELLETLIRAQGLNVNKATSAEAVAVGEHGFGNWTPLIIACYARNPEIVKILIERKSKSIKWTFKDLKGRTALHWAAWRCAASTKLLTKVRGLDWNQVDHDGRPPLYHALWDGNDEAVRAIISMPKINFQVRTEKGETLAGACLRSKNGNPVECLEILISIPEMQ